MVWVGVRIRVGVSVRVRVMVRALILCAFARHEHIWSNVQIDQMCLTSARRATRGDRTFPSDHCTCLECIAFICQNIVDVFGVLSRA